MWKKKRREKKRLRGEVKACTPRGKRGQTSDPRCESQRSKLRVVIFTPARRKWHHRRGKKDAIVIQIKVKPSVPSFCRMSLFYFHQRSPGAEPSDTVYEEISFYISFGKCDRIYLLQLFVLTWRVRARSSRDVLTRYTSIVCETSRNFQIGICERHCERRRRNFHLDKNLQRVFLVVRELE